MILKCVSSLLADVSYVALRDDATMVTGIAYASNKVEEGNLFFCVPGAVVDGHDFAEDAVAHGAAALVVERFLLLDIPQFKVEDARLALAKASSALFDYPSASLDVVGITGTNGKTTTAYLCEWIARSAGKTTGLIGTVETRIAGQRQHADHTTPESYDLQNLFAQMRSSHVETVAMEVSSHAIDLSRIAGTCFKTVAFSNLTQDHLDYHHTMEEYFGVKARLFEDAMAKQAVVCIDDDFGMRLADMLRASSRPLLTCGFSPLADVRIADDTSPSYSAHGTDCSIITPRGRIDLNVPLVGRFNVSNALLAIGIALTLDIDLDCIARALESAPQVPGRLEKVDGCEKGGFSVLVDYAHTPDAVAKAVDVVSQVTSGRVICVFGCGGDRDRGKRPLMGQAALKANIAVVTSDNPRTEKPEAIIADIVAGMTEGKERSIVIADRREAIRHALSLAKPGDCVLIAGKGHEDYQLVGDKVLDFDDRIVAAEELGAL